MQRHLLLPLVLLQSANACSDTWCLDAGCCRSRAVCAIPYIAQPSYRRRRSVSYFDCENSYTCCPPCSQYTCPTGYWLKDNAEWIGGYNVDECCNGPLCSIYNCPEGYILRPDANATPGETDSVCCQATSTSSTTTRTGTTLTTTSWTSTTKTTTSTSTTMVTPGQSSAAAAAFAVKNAIRDGAKTLILGALANSSSAAMETPVGKLTVFSLDKLAQGGKGPSVPVEGGSKLTLPAGLMKSLPQGAVLSTLAIKKQKEGNDTASGTGGGDNLARRVEDDPFYNLRGDNGEKLSAPTMDISMFSSSADELDMGAMQEPLLFKLPETRGNSEGEPQCVYLETTANGTVRWSTKGVRRATMEEVQAAGEAPFGVWCKTEHLSIFSAILLGCMNFELLSPAALEAVVTNEEWPSYQPSILIFCITGLLLGVQAYGVMRERYFLRWGWHQPDARATATSPPKLGIRDLLANGCAKLETQTMIAGVQRCLSVRTGIATGCISKYCWNGHGWIDVSKTAIPRTVQFHKLEFHSSGVEAVVNSDLSGRRLGSVAWRFFTTWKAMHPMLDALRAGTTTVMKRISLFSTTIFGVLASNAMIFQFSGGVRSWEAAEACPVEPTSQLFTIVAVSASIMLNVIPNTVLKLIAKPAGKKIIFNVLFWFLTLLYLCFAGLIVISALANMNSQDQGVWYAAVQWAMGIKILVVPTAKAVKDAFLLELFLLKDKTNCTTRFLVDVGLKNAKERSLDGNLQETVERIARQAISAEELVHFYAMLGNKVMLGYDPDTSTSEDVINGAIKLLSIKPPTSQELPLHIEVVEARLPATGAGADGPLSCSVLHLGKKTRFQRLCIQEHRSSASISGIEGSVARCSWNFTASVVGLELDHALGFRVTARGGMILGIACLTLEEILQGKGFSGELLLHPPGTHGAGNNGRGHGGGDPDPATGRLPLPIELFTVPTSSRAGPPVQPARVTVKVDMPQGYLEALALLELKKLKGWQADASTNGNGNGSACVGAPGSTARDRAGLRADLVASVAERANEEGWSPALAGGAFCKVCNYKAGELPADRMVAHCRKGNFLHFVTAVLADALGDDDAYPSIRRRLLEGDFGGLLQMLKAQKTEGVRYWIDMFAMDLLGGHQDLTPKDTSHWHEQVMAALPSIIRCLKRDCCAQMVADLKASKQPRCTFPTQLLIMDRNFWLMREHSCLAEVMLAKSMDVKQRVVFHPDHMQGPGLGDCLGRVAEELKIIKGSTAEMPWTLQYLEDRQQVYDTLKELVVEGVKEKKDDESVLQDLNLSDIGATIMAHQGLASSLVSAPAALAAVTMSLFILLRLLDDPAGHVPLGHQFLPSCMIHVFFFTMDGPRVSGSAGG